MRNVILDMANHWDSNGLDRNKYLSSTNHVPGTVLDPREPTEMGQVHLCFPGVCFLLGATGKWALILPCVECYGKESTGSWELGDKYSWRVREARLPAGLIPELSPQNRVGVNQASEGRR